MRRQALQPGRLRNLLEAALLLGAMTALTGLLGWVAFGPAGFAWSLLAGAGLLVLGTRWSSDLLLRWTGARELGPAQAPQVHALLARLAETAGLSHPPRLYFIASPVPQAFSTGTGRRAAVAVTGGLLERLDRRELAGVLAHEVSHLRHGDTRLMALAGAFTRLTSAMSTVGLLFLVVDLFLVLAGFSPVPWLLVVLLVVAPSVSSLLQLALSRSREFAADQEATRLTGDPVGLAGALWKLEQPGRWDVLARLLPWVQVPRSPREPSPWLRTHPDTGERLRRLAARVAPEVRRQFPGATHLSLEGFLPPPPYRAGYRHPLPPDREPPGAYRP